MKGLRVIPSHAEEDWVNVEFFIFTRSVLIVFNKDLVALCSLIGVPVAGNGV